MTIFGQSAGSMSVLHHMLAPGSKGLFTKGIAQSGSIYGGRCWMPYPEEKAAKQGLDLANYIGCSTLECLQNVPVEELVFAPFLPRGSLDGHISNDPILPDTPQKLLENGDFTKVPLIIGSTDLEGILIGDIFAAMSIPLFLVNLGWSQIGPLMVAEVMPNEVTEIDTDMANEVKDFYLKSQGGVFTKYNLKEAMQMITDSIILYDVHKTARTVSKFVPTYQYVFSRNGPLKGLNFSQELHEFGVSHADDLFYNFDLSGTGISQFSPLDIEVARIYSTYFYNFALTGDPNFDDNLENWETVKPEDYSYMDIGDEIKMTTDDNYNSRMSFWEELFEKYPQIN